GSGNGGDGRRRCAARIGYPWLRAGREVQLVDAVVEIAIAVAGEVFPPDQHGVGRALDETGVRHLIDVATPGTAAPDVAVGSRERQDKLVLPFERADQGGEPGLHVVAGEDPLGALPTDRIVVPRVLEYEDRFDRLVAHRQRLTRAVVVIVATELERR